MLKIVLRNEDAKKAFGLIDGQKEFFCDAMPTGWVMIDSIQEKYDAKGELFELLIVFSG